MYRTLNDAQHINSMFAEGDNVKVWYVKDEFSRALSMGIKFAVEVEGNDIVDLNNLEKTHVMIGSMAGNPEYDAYTYGGYLQGEYWSPNGEARDLIRSFGLYSTSFERGDILQIGDKFYTWSGMGRYQEFNNDTFKKAK